MTPSERVQAAYQWAFHVRQEHRNALPLRLCAAALLQTVESNEEFTKAEQEIHRLIGSWKEQIRRARKQQRPSSPGLAKAIEAVSKIMDPEPQITPSIGNAGKRY